VAVGKPLSADETTAEQSRITAIERAMESSVKIEVMKQHELLPINVDASHGSAFFVAPNLILTNAHVVMKAGVTGYRITRYQDRALEGSTCSGTLGHVDERIDLALVKVDCEGVPLTLAKHVQVGQDVYVTGHPAALDWIATEGMVSRIIEHSQINQIVADIDVDHGNSGSPMIDSAGRVVGVVEAYNVDGPYLAFAIHLDDVRDFLQYAGVIEREGL
jgi:serine protease Do